MEVSFSYMYFLFSIMQEEEKLELTELCHRFQVMSNSIHVFEVYTIHTKSSYR